MSISSNPKEKFDINNILKEEEDESDEKKEKKYKPQKMKNLLLVYLY